MPRVLLLLLAVVAAAAAAYTCQDNDGCEALGECVAGACRCAAGFTGPSCGSLKLTTTPRADGMVWPAPAARAAGTASSWGFTAVQDPADGLYHAAVTGP